MYKIVLVGVHTTLSPRALCIFRRPLTQVGIGTKLIHMDFYGEGVLRLHSGWGLPLLIV